MEAFFRYSSRNKLAIEDLTRTLEGAHAGFGPNHAEGFRRPVLPVPDSGGPTRAHGASAR